MTTAETILQESQSIDKFLTQAVEFKAIVMAISPQSRAFVAAKFNISDEQAHAALSIFFSEKLGVKYFFDMSLFIDIALQLTFKEF